MGSYFLSHTYTEFRQFGFSPERDGFKENSHEKGLLLEPHREHSHAILKLAQRVDLCVRLCVCQFDLLWKSMPFHTIIILSPCQPGVEALDVAIHHILLLRLWSYLLGKQFICVYKKKKTNRKESAPFSSFTQLLSPWEAIVSVFWRSFQKLHFTCLVLRLVSSVVKRAHHAFLHIIEV